MEKESYLDIGPGPQMFLDDYFLQSIAGVERVVCSPERYPVPVIQATEKQQRIQPFFSVCVYYYSGKEMFRMWYSFMGSSGVSHAYAESADGVHWNMPKLGLVEEEGSKDNNLIPTVSEGATGYPVSVIDNGLNYLHPERRFMFLGYQGLEEKTGAWALFSADGLRWKTTPENPVIPYIWNYGDEWNGRYPFYDTINVFYDPVKKRYIAIVGMLAMPEDGYVGKSRTGPIRRLVGQCESKDFIHWSKPRRIIMPEDRNDMTEFYNMAVVYHHGFFIGFLRILRDDLSADPGGSIQGIGWTELCISRNGDDWVRLAGKFFDRGTTIGSWDHAMAWITSPVYVKDQMFFYYSGYNEGHKVGKRQIGLAQLPQDRFVALESKDNKGRIVTRVFRTSCNYIALNAKSPYGRIRVQLTDRYGRVLPGYSFEECKPLNKDALRSPVRWKERAVLPSIEKAKGIVIEIETHKASVYAIYLE